MSSLWQRRAEKGQPKLSVRASTMPSKIPGLAVPLCLVKGGYQPARPDDASSTDFHSFYELGEVLGSGTVAVVKRAKRLSDGVGVAVKCIANGDEEVRLFERTEFELVRGLRHPGIVRMDSLHESPACLWICMELCSEGSVESYIKKHGCFSKDTAQALFEQLLLAVDYLHEKRIVHRDLKPDNLLLRGDASILKIADFNSAKQIGSSLCSCMLTDRGTRSFSAPELRFGHLWNERVDIWASGLCLFVMLVGKLPFDIQHRSISAVLLLGKHPPIEWEGVSEMTQNLILQCLAIKMRDRPPAMQLLKHAALSGVGELPRLGRASLPQDRQKSCKEDTLYSFFILSKRCGLLSIHPLQQHMNLRSDKDQARTNDWRERRDGALHLKRLAESQFAKTEATGSRERKSSVELELEQEPNHPAEDCDDEEQPPMRRGFTRASLMDLQEEDDPTSPKSQPRKFFTRSSLLDLRSQSNQALVNLDDPSPQSHALEHEKVENHARDAARRDAQEQEAQERMESQRLAADSREAREADTVPKSSEDISPQQMIDTDSKAIQTLTGSADGKEPLPAGHPVQSISQNQSCASQPVVTFADDARVWEDSNVCSVCRSKVGKRYMKPRHHCRVCTKAVCSSCSKSWGLADGAWQRLCDPCAKQALNLTGGSAQEDVARTSTS